MILASSFVKDHSLFVMEGPQAHRIVGWLVAPRAADGKAPRLVAGQPHREGYRAAALRAAATPPELITSGAIPLQLRHVEILPEEHLDLGTRDPGSEGMGHAVGL